MTHLAHAEGFSSIFLSFLDIFGKDKLFLNSFCVKHCHENILQKCNNTITEFESDFNILIRS